MPTVPYRLPAGAFTALILFFCLPPGVAGAGSSAVAASVAERQAFLAAAADIAAGRNGGPARPGLENYILAPYLQHARLLRELKSLDHDRARRFLASEASTSLGAHFRRQYLAELARRGDWKGFLAFDDPKVARSVTLRCQRLRALLAAGRGGETRADLLALWPSGSSLPDACDEPIEYGLVRGWIDGERIEERLRLAANEGNAGLARYLARLLPAERRPAGERLARAVADPAATLSEAANWRDGLPEREAAALALRRLARTNVDAAIVHWQTLSSRFDFESGQKAAILHELALYAAARYRPDAGEWFARVAEDARSERLAEWQLRAALAARDWPAVMTVADGLPAPLADASRPRYWRARALAELDREAEAGAVYAALAGEANFHGFLAADRIDAPYALCPREVAADEARATALRNLPEIARALELHAVGWRTEAVRAWDHAEVDEADRLQLLLLASGQGWHDRVIHALSSGDGLRYYALRFPVAERTIVEREAAANGLDAALSFALIRAESAWQPDARSHANAVGLMQLLPSTGQSMARQLGIPWRGTGTLLDPAVNIRLGSRYLARQVERFDGSPWLAAAAYNAGPAPVQRWLAERGSLPADVFIETIPYGETRDYVARVLAFSVIYDWRLHGKARPLSSRLPEPGSAARPAPPARGFACPSGSV